MYIDSHSHWSDLRFNEDSIQALLVKAAAAGITQHMLGGFDPEDWQRQIVLNQKFPNTFFTCFGLHPYFVSKSAQDECEMALDELVKILSMSKALGETGLDFRDHILESGGFAKDEVISRQIEFFENQLELSKVYKKPLVLHVVRAHEKVFEVFHMWGVPDCGGLVHAFNGSYETAKKYIDLGFKISLGGAVTYDKNKKLQEAVEKIPFDALLIESDSPDQPPQGWKGLNDSSSLRQIASVVADLKRVESDRVLEISTQNFKKLFSL